jgi:hypothetical protein
MLEASAAESFVPNCHVDILKHEFVKSSALLAILWNFVLTAFISVTQAVMNGKSRPVFWPVFM